LTTNEVPLPKVIKPGVLFELLTTCLSEYSVRQKNSDEDKLKRHSLRCWASMELKIKTKLWSSNLAELLWWLENTWVKNFIRRNLR